eukprot:TRINITY_DN73280_c0_g1_i1.p1 TRINITY_DN73280_c0_g1~~TRINITY_DN73280_c0_g1_i1.p1  ORF type:complete len:365 (+),score=21.60 TRINITY_DN73280_c0_g1_i1:77-1171(+)
MRERTKHGMSIYGTQPLEDWTIHMNKQQVLRKEERFIRAPYSGALSAPAIQDYRLPTTDDIVQISGLSRRPELNGSVCRVAATGYDDYNRALIRLDASAGSEGAARPRHMRVSVTRLKLLRHAAASDTDVAELHASSGTRFRASSDTGSLRRPPQSEICRPASLAPSQAGSSLPSTRAPSDAGSCRSFGKGAPLEAFCAGLDESLARSSRTHTMCSSANVKQVPQIHPGEESHRLGSSMSMRPPTAGSGRLRSASSTSKSLTRQQSDWPERSSQSSKEESHAGLHLALKLGRSASVSDRASSHPPENSLVVGTTMGMAQDGVSNSQQKTRPRSASLLTPSLSAGATRRISSAKPSVWSNTSMRS